MPAISVIMPVYNSEKYLPEAVESVLQQSFDDFELILIDDGSTDRSGMICDDYSRKDKRVKVLHQKNKGICAARNAGLDMATGSYIAFCDNDDIYLPKLLEDNYKLAVTYNADVIRFKRLRIKINDNVTEEESANPRFPFRVLKDQGIWKYYNYVKASYCAVWAGIYRRKFIEEHHIRFDTRMRYSAEDRYFNLLVYEHCSCMVLNPKIYYHWMMRYSHSTTGKFNYNFIYTMFYCARKEYELYQMNHVEEYIENYWEKIALDYIKEIFRYINRDVCKLSFLEKRRVLKKVRNRFMIQRLTRKRISEIASKNPLEGALWFCLLRKHYIFLYIILKKIIK